MAGDLGQNAVRAVVSCPLRVGASFNRCRTAFRSSMLPMLSAAITTLATAANASAGSDPDGLSCSS